MALKWMEKVLHNGFDFAYMRVCSAVFLFPQFPRLTSSWNLEDGERKEILYAKRFPITCKRSAIECEIYFSISSPIYQVSRTTKLHTFSDSIREMFSWMAAPSPPCASSAHKFEFYVKSVSGAWLCLFGVVE